MLCNPLPVRVAGSHRPVCPVSIVLIVLCLFTYFGTSARAQSNALTLPRTLDQLVDESHVVIQGWVTRVTVQPHGSLRNLMTLSVTLQLEDSLKGNPPNLFTFTQAVLDRTDLQREMGYRPGQHLFLILIKPNSYGLA